MSDAGRLLSEYGALADEQRRLIDSEAYDGLNASFARAAELNALIEEAFRGAEITPALRETLAALREKVAENSGILSARMKELGKSNARRADIRRGLASYDPMPFSQPGVIDVKM
ncbi:MAG: hypothetical protein LBD49_03840 [Oscillospiraceae bacterium]|jgi:hypothetical protein|nr:hypothetical protein [Oscillospiraceae bacterium]